MHNACNRHNNVDCCYSSSGCSPRDWKLAGPVVKIQRWCLQQQTSGGFLLWLHPQIPLVLCCGWTRSKLGTSSVKPNIHCQHGRHNFHTAKQPEYLKNMNGVQYPSWISQFSIGQQQHLQVEQTATDLSLIMISTIGRCKAIWYQGSKPFDIASHGESASAHKLEAVDDDVLQAFRPGSG